MSAQTIKGGLLKLTVNELFSGIGSQRKALDKLHINHEVIGISEIDEPAIKSYETIFGETRNYGDISKIEKLDYADFWTYSFPCTDISMVGKRAGIKEGTHSGLLLQVKRLLHISYENNELPKYLMLENVKALVNKDNKPDFEEWLKYLESLGYNNYWKVIDAKNCGIPVRRERVFVISIRKDIDDLGFQFSQNKELRFTIEDLTGINNGEYPLFYDDRDKGFGIKSSKICPTQRANRYGIKIQESSESKRPMTIEESWLLTGFSLEDIKKCKLVNSKTQLFKQSGNSIVVDVLMSIFEVLFKDYIID